MFATFRDRDLRGRRLAMDSRPRPWWGYREYGLVLPEGDPMTGFVLPTVPYLREDQGMYYLHFSGATPEMMDMSGLILFPDQGW